MLYPDELQALKPKHAVNIFAAECRWKVVGVERFELPTFCSQSRRATRLRYTPISHHLARGGIILSETYEVNQNMPVMTAFYMTSVIVFTDIYVL